MVNPSLSRQFTLTNFVWKLRSNGHLQGEKIGAVNYLKLSRIPTDIRIYWNSTNNRATAFAVDELVRGFRINEKDEAGNAKTLENVWLWSEGEIPIEPLSDIIEIEYNGAGDLIEPLLGNKSGSIDKIEKVQVVSAIDKILQPIKVVNYSNANNYSVTDFYRINANIKVPIIKKYFAQVDYGELNETFNEWGNDYGFFEKTGFYKQGSTWNTSTNHNTAWDTYKLASWGGALMLLQNVEGVATFGFCKNLLTQKGELSKDFLFGLQRKITGYKQTNTPVYYNKNIEWQEGNYFKGNGTSNTRASTLSPARTAFVSFFATGIFENFLKIKEVPKNLSMENNCLCVGAGTLIPKPLQTVCLYNFETTTDEKFSLFIFKTRDKTSFLSPAKKTTLYISLIGQKNKKNADFAIKIVEISKTNTADAYIYLGGIEHGLKLPIKAGFELAFNNKKSGMDYAVLEIPAGDIYKVELELLNVYEDSDND